ncbi:hypothetical protein Ddye_005973 [Dipteronia dyeriana]|uniref:J domain-containing protein n=1 Tax=Dipteronia dyeriana TaxID=168575 RepID=A0AAE0CQ44_9ROSI|nr:hypothetical protein Ddye_005973 [Dipteronia dyeriana]
MDEFGVLTERFGLKPQGKSAPMAASKRSAATTLPTRSFASNPGLNTKPSSYDSNSFNGFPDDILFQSKSNKNSSSGFDDVFNQFQNSTSSNSNNGSSLDFSSMFSASSNSGSKSYTYVDDDVFGLNSKNDDVFGSFVSPTKQSGLDDDLLGDFGGVESRSSKSFKQNAAGFDDLIPGFSASTSPVNGTNVKAAKSTFMSAEDPFVVLERTSTPGNCSSDPFTDPLEELGQLTQSRGSKPNVSKVSPILKPPPRPAQVLKVDQVKTSGLSSIDELENFAVANVPNSADGNSGLHHPKERHSAKASKYKEAEDAAQKTPKKGGDDLESFFSVGSRSSSVPRSRAPTTDPVFEAKVNSRGPDVAQKKSSGGLSTIRKVSSANNVVDDLSSIFGDAPMFGEFEEYEGEPEERRRARLGRQQRTNNRMAQAIADMNQRDFQTQQEQEERSRIADGLDFNIKRWAAGKEGNMRALLSSLQQVLWPECGWEPVSLTDLITSSNVKKVYRKATLCVHPDKVQQKGSTIQQKYTAEKVFDILKEAWNKFSKEELS